MTHAHADLEFGSATEFKATAADVTAAVMAVHPFTSAKAVKPALEVIRFELDDGYLLAVATDSYGIGTYRVALTDWHKDNVDDTPVVVHLDRADAVRLVKFAASDKIDTLHWRVADDAVTVTLADGNRLTVTPVQLLDAYLPWRRMFAPGGTETGRERFGLGRDRLAAVIAAHKALHVGVRGVGDPLVFWPDAVTGQPVAVTIGERFTAVLAPYRLGDEVAFDHARFQR